MSRLAAAFAEHRVQETLVLLPLQRLVSCHMGLPNAINEKLSLLHYLFVVLSAERSVQETMALEPLQELEEKRSETDFAAALCGLTILRYLTDYLPQLPLGLMARQGFAGSAGCAYAATTESASPA